MNRKTIFFTLVSIILLNSCTVLNRSIKYWTPDITDYEIFPYYKFEKSKKPFQFHQAPDSLFNNILTKSNDSVIQNFKTFISKSSTKSFLIIRNDTILYEYYQNDFKRNDITTIFSISKSITSLLIGIALDEGLIKDINDPITLYLPEFKKRDPQFKNLTIYHLLQMRAGFKFNENSEIPLSKISQFYYGRNQLGKAKRMKFEYKPNEKHIYQSVSTVFLGLILERVTGKTMAEYFNEKVWQYIKAENNATWSLDDKKNRSAKAFSGLNISAIDLAKIGRIYLNKGKFNNKQIVSEKWIEQSLTPDSKNDGYQLQWYSTAESVKDTTGKTKIFQDSIKAINYTKKYHKNSTTQLYKSKSGNWYILKYNNYFFAAGILQQYMFLIPDKNIIIIRLGEGKEYYFSKLYKIARYLDNE